VVCLENVRVCHDYNHGVFSYHAGNEMNHSRRLNNYLNKEINPMSTEENKALFHRFVNEVANKGNLSLIDELTSPDLVEHEELPPGTPPGREAVKYFFAAWRQGFPDGQVTVEKAIAEGDLVSCYMTWRGTHTGEFFGIPASGKPVTFKGNDIVRVANGQVVEHWAVTDNLSLMQQIGAIPQPDEAGI
jgi:steroid delta-isomerase-like uncharacterized protein